MTSSPSLTTAPLPLSGQSGIGWSIRRPSPGRPGDGRDQLGNFQTALLGRITPASTSIGIDLEIGNNCPGLSAIKNAQLLLKNKEQLTASGWCAPHPKRGWAALPGAGQGVCRAGARYAAPGTVI